MTASFRFITYFINNYNLILAINYLFDILRVYRKLSLDSLALLIKAFSFKSYKSRIYKKIISNFYYKIY